MASEIAPGVIEIDTRLGGFEHLTAGYLLTGPQPLLVETGAQSSLAVLLDSLAELGVGAGDLAGVAVTHIHLDHAGGVGDVARAFPAATVYVHERGARHLADPRKLVASAAMVYGERLDSLYGRLEPTEPERVSVLGDGEELDLGGGRRLRAIDSPGHAKHHLGFLDSQSGLLFAGDAVGVKLPGGGALRPATPPPDFDLEQALASLRRFAEHAPQAIALAHYGLVPGDPLELLDDAAQRLSAWAAEATRAWSAGEDIAAALEERFRSDSDGADPAQRERLDILNGYHSNAAGFRRWLETSQLAAASGTARPTGAAGASRAEARRGADGEGPGGGRHRSLAEPARTQAAAALAACPNACAGANVPNASASLKPAARSRSSGTEQARHGSGGDGQC